jgi:hypothetical protein
MALVRPATRRASASLTVMDGLTDSRGEGVLRVLLGAGAPLDSTAHQKLAKQTRPDSMAQGWAGHSRDQVEGWRETVGQVGEQLRAVVGRVYVLRGNLEFRICFGWEKK